MRKAWFYSKPMPLQGLFVTAKGNPSLELCRRWQLKLTETQDENWHGSHSALEYADVTFGWFTGVDISFLQIVFGAN
jgi:hypothetical protein